jgi:hypothetical protein
MPVSFCGTESERHEIQTQKKVAAGKADARSNSSGLVSKLHLGNPKIL